MEEHSIRLVLLRTVPPKTSSVPPWARQMSRPLRPRARSASRPPMRRMVSAVVRVAFVVFAVTAGRPLPGMAWVALDHRGHAWSVAVDPQGHVIAAGDLDFTASRGGSGLIKLDGTSGSPLWRYNPQTGQQYYLIALTPSGDAVTTTYSYGYGAGVYKHSGVDGTGLWNAGLGYNICPFDPPVVYRYDYIANIVATADGDIVVAGSSRYCGANTGWPYTFAVQRFNGATGATVWLAYPHVLPAPDVHRAGEATTMIVAPDGNIIVGGSVVWPPFGGAAYIAKLDVDTGATVWEFGDPASSTVLPPLVLNEAGDVFAACAGFAQGQPVRRDSVVKLSGATGERLWSGSTSGGRDCCADGSDSTTSLADSYHGIALDSHGDLMVAREVGVQTPIPECRGESAIAWARIDGVTGETLWDSMGPAIITPDGAICPTAARPNLYIDTFAVDRANDDIVFSAQDLHGFVLVREAKQADGAFDERWSYEQSSGQLGQIILTDDAVVASGFIQQTFMVMKLNAADGSGRCGDQVVDHDEECDDGNHANGDGCSAACIYEDLQCENGDTVTFIPTQQRRKSAGDTMKAPLFDPEVGPSIGTVRGRITRFRFSPYPPLGVYTHEAFIPMDKVDAINDAAVGALRVKLDNVFGDKIAGILSQLGIGFLTQGIFEIMKLSVNGNDRGHDPAFSPGDCKISVVLDFENGDGWVMMNHTTAVAEVDVPFPPTTIHLLDVSRTAVKARKRWKKGDWSWFWADWVNGETFRLRYEVRLAVPLLPVGDLTNGFLAAIDHQILIDRQTGRVSFEGDAFPSTGTYRYKCSGHSRVMDQQNATDPGALSVEREFSFDQPIIGGVPNRE